MGHNVFEKYGIPEMLCNYVVTFFWDDPKTFGQWLQACRENHSLCLDKMTAMKVWWDEVHSFTLTEDTEDVRKEVFHASFSKELDLHGYQIGDEGCEALAPGLAQMTALEVLNLIDNQIGDKGCEALAPALAQMTALEFHC